MDQQLKQIVKSSIIRTLCLAVFMSVLSAILIWLVPTSVKLNLTALYSGITTLATGAMVAILLAVFYSSAERIKYIRDQLGAASLFIVVLLDLMLIVLVGAIIDWNRTANFIAFSVLLCAVIDLGWIVTRLLLIALKK